MRVSDLLTRLAALLTLITSAWNVVVAVLWILSFWWLLVGFLWLIPLVLALANIVLAFVSLVRGHHRAALGLPLLGLFVGLCNFNFIAMFMDLLILGLMISGYAARSSEEREGRRVY
jgi:hypothetical protein